MKGIAIVGIFILAFALATVAGVHAQSAPHSTVPVTADNFVRAETDLYFGQVVKRDGFGKFIHLREVTPLDRQTVIRSNRDTLNSSAVFDLDAGPVTIALPDGSSLQVDASDRRGSVHACRHLQGR